MRRNLPTLALAALFVLPIVGCGTEGESFAAPIVTDSAGVRIITNPGGGAWAAGEAWTLVEELRIGVETGDPELQFGMLIGVDATDDGRIVTVDQQAQRVRVFDADGSLLHAFGRAGGGPGELSTNGLSLMTGVLVDADGNVVVPDLGNARIARFSIDGGPLTSPNIDFENGIPVLFTRTADRSIIAQFRSMAIPGMPSTEETTPTDRIVRFNADASDFEVLASFPAGGTFSMSASGMPSFRFFSPEPVWTVLSDGRIVAGTNDEYSLGLGGSDGEVATIVRRNVTRHPVTTQVEDRIRDLLRESFEASGQEIPDAIMEQLMAGIEFETHWPALAAILPGPDATLWVQRIDPMLVADLSMEDLQTGRIGSPNWDVIDIDGTYLGVVEMPSGFVPSRFVGSHLYGTHHDDLGIQRILRLRLDR